MSKKPKKLENKKTWTKGDLTQDSKTELSEMEKFKKRTDPLGKAGLDKLAQKDEAKTQIQMPTEKMLSVKQRLLRRAQLPAYVSFSDDRGEFKIPIRLLDPHEQAEFMQLQIDLIHARGKVANAKGLSEEEILKLARELQQKLNDFYALAGKICLDPELNEEYWRSGSGFNNDVPTKLINEAIRLSQETREDAVSFRADGAGQGAVADVPRTRKNPK